PWGALRAMTIRPSHRSLRAALLLGLVALVAAGLAACGSRVADEARLAADDPDRPGALPTTTTNGNPASDVGVTSDEIHVGIIVSKTSPLGSETFSSPMYGARAYFESLNERGGINGRTVKVTVCDDGATGAGNRRCARQLIEDD